jgi:hypothetical protein
VENESERKIRCLRSDGGKEYFSGQFNNYLQQTGIWREFSWRYTLEQNGMAKRKNRSIVEVARAMLEEKSLPKFYWAEAVRTTVYIQNRIGDKVSAHERYFGAKPNCNTYGCSVVLRMCIYRRRNKRSWTRKPKGVSWYLPFVWQPDSNPSSDGEVSDAEMPLDVPEIRTRPESPISVPLIGPSAGLGRIDRSDKEPASSGDSVVHSPREQPKRRFTRKEKGKRKVSDADTQRDESCRREADSEAQGARISAEKSVSGNERLRRSTRTKKPVERFGYNEYMAHYYAYMTRVAEVREPESYA